MIPSILFSSSHRSELSKIHQLCHIRSVVKGLPLTAGHFVLFVTIVTFAASGNLVTPRVVFVVLPITLSLLHSVALHFFKSCVLWGEVMVVMKRTQVCSLNLETKFLSLCFVQLIVMFKC